MSQEWWLLLAMIMVSLLQGGAPGSMETVLLGTLEQSLTLWHIIWFCPMQLPFRDTGRNIKYGSVFSVFFYLFNLMLCVWFNGGEDDDWLTDKSLCFSERTKGEDWNSLGFCLVWASYKIKGWQPSSSKIQRLSCWMVKILGILHWFRVGWMQYRYSNSNVGFVFYRFIHPIVYGEYPRTMQEIVGDRLPKFTKAEVKMVKGSMDFVGINQYTAYYMYDKPKPKVPGYQEDWHAGFACMIQSLSLLVLLFTVHTFIVLTFFTCGLCRWKAWSANWSKGNFYTMEWKKIKNPFHSASTSVMGLVLILVVDWLNVCRHILAGSTKFLGVFTKLWPT